MMSHREDERCSLSTGGSWPPPSCSSAQRWLLASASGKGLPRPTRLPFRDAKPPRQ